MTNPTPAPAPATDAANPNPTHTETIDLRPTVGGFLAAYAQALIHTNGDGGPALDGMGDAIVAAIVSGVDAGAVGGLIVSDADRERAKRGGYDGAANPTEYPIITTTDALATGTERLPGGDLALGLEYGDTLLGQTLTIAGRVCSARGDSELSLPVWFARMLDDLEAALYFYNSRNGPLGDGDDAQPWATAPGETDAGGGPYEPRASRA